ncbi:MAG: hypothetical protein C0606_12385 [Hyphomicrobiales bacterium]|nr:MAG: hypothetical protein C0606_12385 [Hyphomicrobiales bacterium]
METRANFVAIGAFVLAVLFAGFGFVYWLSNTSDTKSSSEVVIVFDGTVTGLGIGGQVLFNGIKIGDVARMSLNPEDPNKVLVLARVDNTVPLKTDTKAELGYQGLTGVAHIQLKGGSPDAKSLFDTDGTPVIQADMSAFENLIEGAQTLLAKANTTLDAVEKIATENKESISTTVKNVEKFSDALAKNSDGVDTFLADVAEAARTVSGLSGRIESFVEKAESLVTAVDSEKVGKVIDNAVTVSDKLAAASGDVDAVIADIRKAAGDLSAFGENINETLAKVDAIVTDVDRDALKKVVANAEEVSNRIMARADDFDAMMTNAKGAVDDVRGFTSGLEKNKEDIDSIVKSARQFADRINGTGERLDNLLVKLDDMIDADGKGFITEATEAARSIAKAASAFEKRADNIAAGLERFSTRGLRNVEAVVGQTQRTLSVIERAFSNLERDPSQIIFGGSSTPQYRPRRR